MKWGLTFEIHQEALVSGDVGRVGQEVVLGGIREQDGCCVSTRWLGVVSVLGGWDLR